VPRAIALVQALRTLTTGTAGFFAMRRDAKRMVPKMEAEVQALGRYYGTSSVAMPVPAPAEEQTRLTA